MSSDIKKYDVFDYDFCRKELFDFIDRNVDIEEDKVSLKEDFDHSNIECETDFDRFWYENLEKLSGDSPIDILEYSNTIKNCLEALRNLFERHDEEIKIL